MNWKFITIEAIIAKLTVVMLKTPFVMRAPVKNSIKQKENV